MVGGGVFYLLLSNMSIYILLQVNSAINNLNKHKILPSFTIRLQFQYSTWHFLTTVGSQGWKGTQKAVGGDTTAWDKGEGESWAKATPGSVLSPGHTQNCLPSKLTFLT